MDFDEDDLVMTSERPASSRGGMPQRPTTSGGQRPTTSNRPMSRRGSAMTPAGGRPFSRQASAIGGRPLGSAIGGPGGGAGGRLGSAMHRTAVPGTASRLQGMKIQDLNWKKNYNFFFHTTNLCILASAMQQRPLSSRGGIGLQTPVQVADRPITQQGLSGIRTGATGTR